MSEIKYDALDVLDFYKEQGDLSLSSLRKLLLHKHPEKYKDKNPDELEKEIHKSIFLNEKVKTTSVITDVSEDGKIKVELAYNIKTKFWKSGN